LNGVAHSRICERVLNTPGKTGLPGNVKPANYFPFIEFSVQVFDAFQARGWQRFDPASWGPGQPTVIESFPLAAWRSLGLPCLPAKKKTRDTDIHRPLSLSPEPVSSLTAPCRLMISSRHSSPAWEVSGSQQAPRIGIRRSGLGHSFSMAHGVKAISSILRAIEPSHGYHPSRKRAWRAGTRRGIHREPGADPGLCKMGAVCGGGWQDDSKQTPATWGSRSNWY
jgi:hypothetical protein